MIARLVFLLSILSFYVGAIEKVLIAPQKGFEIVSKEAAYTYSSSITTIVPFEIQKFEFRVANYIDYLKGTQQSQKLETFLSAQYEPNDPMTMITWQEAQKACHYYKGRLPTQEEWMVAASIKSAKSLCYEDITLGSFVPLSSTIITKKSGSRIACHEAIDDEFDLEETISELNSVGYALENINGTFGMLGNVWEWVDAKVNYFHKSYRVIKGGSFTNAKEVELFDSRYENFLDQDSKRPNVGFRCVWDTRDANKGKLND